MTFLQLVLETLRECGARPVLRRKPQPRTHDNIYRGEWFSASCPDCGVSVGGAHKVGCSFSDAPRDPFPRSLFTP